MGKTKILAAAAALLLSSASAFAQYVDPVTGVSYSAIDGTNFYANEGAAKACDGSDQTKLGTGDCPNFVVIEASKPVIMSGYTIITANDNASYTGRNPKDWKIEGSNDKMNWETIVTVTDDQVLQDVNFTPFDFTVDGVTTPYQYFKFTVTRVAGGGFMQYSEFHPAGEVHEHSWAVTGGTPATCVKHATVDYTCSTCGATKSEVDEASAFAAHQYTDRVCGVCGRVAGYFEAVTVVDGFNADVVVEEVPVADHLVGGFDNGTVGFYTTGIEYAEGKYYNDFGLPVNGHLVSNAGLGIDYYLGYGAGSALRIGGDNDEHVVTIEPVNTAALAVLGTSAGGPSNTVVTVTYEDGTTTTANLAWADWCGGATDGVAYLNLERFWGDTRQENLYFRLFEKVIPTDPTKQVVSVSFRQNGTYNTPVIMAISSATINENGIYVESTYGQTSDSSAPAVAVNFIGHETVFVNRYATETIKLVDASDNVVATSTESTDNYSLETYACDVTTFLLSEAPAVGDYKLVIPAGSLVAGEGVNFHLNHVDVVVPVTVTDAPAVLAKKGDVTAIQNVQNATSNRIYNIQGVEVKSASQPGLYIINGKKYMVK